MSGEVRSLALTEGDYTHCHSKVANVVSQKLAIICGLPKEPPVPIINMSLRVLVLRNS